MPAENGELSSNATIEAVQKSVADRGVASRIHVTRDRDDNNLPLLQLDKGGRDGKSFSGGKKVITQD